jgi:hypothetical protein
MKWYLISCFTDSGRVTTQILAEDEAEDLDTTPYSQFEGYDRYVDEFSGLDDALEAEKEAKEA